MQGWTKITEYEKEFAGTLGGTVRYEPHLVNHIGKDLIYERYALKDLDKDGTPFCQINTIALARIRLYQCTLIIHIT